MSVDIVAIVPALDHPTWVAWQAGQVTALTRAHRPGTWRFRQAEQAIYNALDQAFNAQLDQWHTWVWDHALGGLITVDRRTPDSYPYLGVVPVDALTLDAIAAAEHDLLSAALTDAGDRLQLAHAMT